MTEKEKSKGGRPKGKTVPPEAAHDSEEVVAAADDLPEATPPASAKSIPRPSRSLAVSLGTNVGSLKVSLLADPENVPSLEDVERVNTAAGSDVRTPLLAVVQAVLADAGGTMTLADIVPKVRKYWNRPFPTGPYTGEEFVYLMVAGSDNIRVAEQ